MPFDTITAQMDKLRQDFHALDKRVALMERDTAAGTQFLQKIITQNDLIISLLRDQRTSVSSRNMKWLEYFRPIVKSAVQWSIGLLTMAFIAKGGDLLQLLEKLEPLLKLF